MKTSTCLSAVVLCIGLSGAATAAFAQSAAPATPSAAPASDAARPKVTSRGWTIEFKHSATSDGVIHFRAWPYQAAPIDVSLPVTKGQTRNSIARHFEDAFLKSLGDDYRVGLAKEYVRITAVRGERRFALELVENTADGVTLELSRQ